jgi:hypothetical protein
MGTNIVILKISLNKQGLFFRKVGYSRYDVPSEMFLTKHIDLGFIFQHFIISVSSPKII